MKIVFSILSLCFMTIASASSYDGMIMRPESIYPIVAKCQRLVPEDAKKKTECGDAHRAMVWVVTQLKTRQSDPQKFGHKIMSMQKEIATLESHAKKTPEISEKIAALRIQVKAHLAILRLSSKPS